MCVVVVAGDSELWRMRMERRRVLVVWYEEKAVGSGLLLLLWILG